jgi:hypothetical protein
LFPNPKIEIKKIDPSQCHPFTFIIYEHFFVINIAEMLILI